MIAVGLSLIPVVWIATSLIDKGNPTWWKPFPMALVILAILTKSRIWAFVIVSILVVGSFLRIAWRLEKHPDGRPMLSLFVYGLLYVLNAVYLASNFARGVRYDGWRPTVAVCGMSLLLLAGLVPLRVLSEEKGNFLSVLAFHWIAWLWLILYAFPLLGPMFTLV